MTTDRDPPRRGVESPSQTIRTLAARLVEACCAARAANPSDPRVAAVEGRLRRCLAVLGNVRGEAKGLASFGHERHTVWILRFEDSSLDEMVWDAATHGEIGAEELARDAYRRHSSNWNCTLLHTAALEETA